MNEYYLVFKRFLKKEKRVIFAIAVIIIGLLIVWPFIADMITGDNFHATKITPVKNEHCMIYDISGDSMLYQCSGSTDIFLSDLNGSVYKSVGYYVSFYPVLDEKGEKFALYESASSNLGIYDTIDPDKNKQISVDDLQGTSFKDIAWSPKGDKIALLISDSLNSSDYLYTYDLDSGEAKHLFSSPEYFSVPSWSPDENYLSFIAHADSQSTESTMFIADLENSNVSASALKIKDNTHTNIPERSAWSPKGDKIAYSESGTVGICDPDGKNSRLIKCYDNNSICLHLEWSPGGDKILYEFNLPPDLLNSERIGVIYVETGDVKEILASSFKYGYSLSWADDGRKIAYLENDGIYDNGYLVDLDSSSKNNPLKFMS